MQQIVFERFGVPAEVAQAVDVPEPGSPGPHEALVDLLAAPIHPADLLNMAGLYGVERPSLPRVAGFEGAGRVLAVGGLVKHVKPGDVVPILRPGDGAWRERQLLPADTLIALPPGGDPQQYAMLLINPATALLMLTEVVPLEQGEWVIQNAANSAVGQYLIQLAQRRGWRTVNVVRRPGLAQALNALGADVVLVDGDDLSTRVERATGGARIRLAIDAVAGSAGRRLAACLAESGVLCNYGLLSGQPIEVPPAELIFRGISVRGFWLGSWVQQAGTAGFQKVFAELVPLVAAKVLHACIEATYPLGRVKAAIEHAARGGRDGKILLIPR